MFKREKFLETIKEQGRTRSWLAEKLDVSYNTINRYLRGEAEPTKSVAMAMAVYLQVKPSEFWENDDTPKAS